MGLPMAVNLAAAGHQVRGFDLAPACLAAADEAGLPLGDSLAATVAGVELVITMLPDGAAVIACYQQFLDGIAGLEPGTVLLDCSTIGVLASRQVEAVASSAGFLSVDAPVSGGVEGARAATLTFMVGGSDEAFARVEPALLAMGATTVHCGPRGAGQAAKLCNNMILGASMAVVSEAFVLGEAFGLSADSLYRVASKSSGNCFALTQNCPVPGPVLSSPANHDYLPGFAADLMLKDLRLAQAAAQAAGVSAAIGQSALARYEQLSEQGRGSLDFSAVVLSVRDAGTGG